MKEYRFVPITADLFAEALLKYIKGKEWKTTKKNKSE